MNVAFIPVRGGSKSIPLKNIKLLNGKPLVYWTIKAAVDCLAIDKVYVATDSDEIKKVVNNFNFDKVIVIGRSEENSTDTASTESIMLEFAKAYDFDNIALIQATSPMLLSTDLDEGFKIYSTENVDTVFSTVRQKRFHWEIENGLAIPTNYNPLHRPRRQDYDGYLVENGAFYITSKNSLTSSNCRMSGNMKIYEMDEATYFEIDEPSDWIIIEHLMKNRSINSNTNDILKNIKLVATDCDGVLTDGGMYYDQNGDAMKKFNTLDGMGFELLRNAGIKTAIITGENTSFVKKRGSKLKIDDLIMGEKNKLGALKILCEKYGFKLSEVAYIGDDVFDVPAIEECGFGVVPCSAFDNIKDKSDYVTTRAGGKGCFREVAELILNKISI